MKSLIYVVEDEEVIRELYKYSLEGLEFDIECFENAESFFERLSKKACDIVLLDVMLEGMDGYEILSKFKSIHSNIPVIMVSAKGEEVSKVKGLNLGADDYISKPFGILELAARIKANLRKTKEKEIKINEYKDICIDEVRHEISINKTKLTLTLKEYNLIKYLCENNQKVMNREDIFLNVWGENFIGETRTLDVHIKEIRKKLIDNNSVCKIETVRSIGYMLS